MPQAYLPAHGVNGAHPLDNPVRSSLCGPHAHFVQRRGDVLRYPADVSPFVALPDRPRAADWADLAALAGPGAMVALAGVAPPDGWPVTPIGQGVQLVHEGAGGGRHGRRRDRAARAAATARRCLI